MLTALLKAWDVTIGDCLGVCFIQSCLWFQRRDSQISKFKQREIYQKDLEDLNAKLERKVKE